MKNKKFKNSKAWLIPLTVAIITVSAVTTVMYMMFGKGKEIAVINDDDIPVAKLNTDNSPVNYINETNYKGELERFPELYESPFRKTNSYICNKDFTKTNEKDFENYKSLAKDFFEGLCNVNYHNIANNKYGYTANLLKNVEYMAYHTENIGEEDELTLYMFEYIQNIADYFIDNKVQMEAEFFTDNSLIYRDYYTFVRGELVFTIYETKDTDCGYETGIEYHVPVEVALELSPEDSSEWQICAFGLVSDENYYLNS